MPTRGLLSEGQRARFSALPDMDARALTEPESAEAFEVRFAEP